MCCKNARRRRLESNKMSAILDIMDLMSRVNNINRYYNGRYYRWIVENTLPIAPQGDTGLDDGNDGYEASEESLSDWEDFIESAGFVSDASMQIIMGSSKNYFFPYTFLYAYALCLLLLINVQLMYSPFGI